MKDNHSRAVPRSSPEGERRAGIALMVVMVVFIILYLVVFQLHYTTRLEEKISKARSADSQGSSAMQSVVLSILTLLAQDYQAAGQSSTGATAGNVGMSGPSTQKSDKDEGKDGGAAGGLKSSAGDDPAAPGAAPGSAGWYDYLGEPIFGRNSQSLNGITVKQTVIDNERCFDLNQLWSYPPSRAETMTELSEEESAKRAEDPLSSLADPAKKDTSKSKSSSSKSQSKSSSSKSSGAMTQAGLAGATGLGEEAPPAQEVGAGLLWEPPDEEVRRETVKMLERTIDMMYRLNTEHGFEYRIQPPQPEMLADAIERYAFDRRSEPVQNYIHLPSELLNVLAMLGASPEVYYGPIPPLRQGEEFFDRDGSFRYYKDEYGDLEGEFVYAEDLTGERELMQAQLEELRSTFGDFMTFPEFGRMGNPLTQNMQELAEVEDEEGNVSLAVPPMPLGLRDIFTTFSKGKININTAPVPILYALLPLIIETEPDGERRAQGIALNIEDYRYTYQPEGGEGGEAGAAADGGAQGKTKSKKKQGSRETAALLEASGVAGAVGLSAEELAAASGDSSSTYPTNYFTGVSAAQLKLIDGEEGGPDDYLTDQGSATTTTDLESMSPLQKVAHDYGKVMVCQSTFFTATLKSRAEDSPAIRTGYLTVLRDVGKKRVEVVQWKELQQ